MMIVFAGRRIKPDHQTDETSSRETRQFDL
jgi:hypothetical protein